MTDLVDTSTFFNSKIMKIDNNYNSKEIIQINEEKYSSPKNKIEEKLKVQDYNTSKPIRKIIKASIIND